VRIHPDLPVVHRVDRLVQLGIQIVGQPNRRQFGQLPQEELVTLQMHRIVHVPLQRVQVRDRRQVSMREPLRGAAEILPDGRERHRLDRRRTPHRGQHATGRIDKRQAILDAAFTIFARDGYYLAGVDAIAAEARVAKHTIYNHFRDKENLFREVSQRGRHEERRPRGNRPPGEQP